MSSDRPSLALIRSALDIVITVWNAHVMATEAWGHPEHLVDLQRLALDASATEGTLATLAVLSTRRQEFAEDIRVVSKWELTLDDLGQHRFDCTGRLPDPDKAQGAQSRSAR